MISDTELFDAQGLTEAISHNKSILVSFRDALRHGNEILRQRFIAGAPAHTLVEQRAWLIDQLLQQAWQQHVTRDDLALVAVGGYGRGELHPCSDVDIMILLPEQIQQDLAGIEQFLMLLWDIGLEVGQSVRSLNDCLLQASADITVATNLMEARLLYGNASLFEAMSRLTAPDKIWPGREFYQAKLAEQVTRHRKFNDTAYNLEPNIKEGPGGLRDIQMIGWVAKRHFNTPTLHGLVEHQFLTEPEYQDLINGQDFLWKIRIALHLQAKRREDRLLFDHQRTLAKSFGYTDDAHNLAVEKFMKDYYRTVKDLSLLNEMLLQLFNEELLNLEHQATALPLNARFQVLNGYLEATESDIFQRHPPALLELFLLLEQHPEIKGVRAGTMRLIRQHRYLINDNFRADPACQSLFMQIMRQKHGVTHQLRRMHRYGVLGDYLPVFAQIIGQMQHDLFHVYTVDEHTLTVLRNVRRFSVPEFVHEFPLCSTIFEQIPNPEPLYIAALFHDIAKGRGGDHSELGASDAADFCNRHQMCTEDTETVIWLVRHHLLMSTTAQRKDLSDPEVINKFALKMATQSRLNFLYLLTVADIRATSPEVWNSWKDALLKELYNATTRALKRGLEHPLRQDERIHHVQQQSMEQLKLHRLGEAQVQPLWNQLGKDYFLMHSADEVAWQARAILSHPEHDLPLIMLRQQTKRGGTELFIYSRDQDHLFAHTTAAITQVGLNIADARIYTSQDGHTLDTFIILEDNGQPIDSPSRLHEIQHFLDNALRHPEAITLKDARRMPSRLKHFPIITEVSFQDDPGNQRTAMKVIAADRPGLLARIGLALVDCRIRLKNAKVSTLGERAEDIFFITDQDNHPLTHAAQLNELRDRVIFHMEH